MENNELLTNKYKIIKLLGEGSFGKVYLSEELKTNNKVVIKSIDIRSMSEIQKNLIINEIKIMKKLNHFNVIKYIDFIYDKKNYFYFIIMEYANKGDLSNIIFEKKNSKKIFNEKEILSIFIQIIHGLKYIHFNKIIHRDLKSQNIFLLKNKNNNLIIKLGDFGISKILNNTLNNASTIIGTPFYFSPEIINGEKYDYKSDLWSLGIILYQMMTLRLPFDSNNFATLSMKIIKGEYNKNINGYSKELKEICFGLLNIDKKKRLSLEEILNKKIIQDYIYNKKNKTSHNNDLNDKKILRTSLNISRKFSSTVEKNFNQIKTQNFKDILESHKKTNSNLINKNLYSLNNISNIKNDKFENKNHIFNNYTKNKNIKKVRNKIKSLDQIEIEILKKNNINNILEEFMKNKNEKIKKSNIIIQNLKNEKNKIKDDFYKLNYNFFEFEEKKENDEIKLDLDFIKEKNFNEENENNPIKENIIKEIGINLYNEIYNILKINYFKDFENIIEYNFENIKNLIKEKLKKNNNKYKKEEIKKAFNYLYDFFSIILEENNMNNFF